jgi:hypothetical protein
MEASGDSLSEAFGELFADPLDGEADRARTF